MKSISNVVQTQQRQFLGESDLSYALSNAFEEAVIDMRYSSVARRGAPGQLPKLSTTNEDFFSEIDR